MSARKKKPPIGTVILEKIDAMGAPASVLIAVGCAAGVVAVLAFAAFSGFGGAADFIYNQF